jgi:hypothetical protein
MNAVNLLFHKFRKLQQCLLLRTGIFILIFAAIVCSILASYSLANHAERLYKPSRDKTASTSKQGCCAQDFDKPHRIAASY